MFHNFIPCINHKKDKKKRKVKTFNLVKFLTIKYNIKIIMFLIKPGYNNYF